MPAPSSAGCSGPEKIIVLPQVRTRRAVSASGNTITAPPAENALASEATITVRCSGGPSPSTVPRPCCPRPAHTVRVVDVQRQAFVPRQQLAQRQRAAPGRRACCRRRRPDTRRGDGAGPARPRALSSRSTRLWRTKRQRGPRRLERRQHRLHAVVHELVADDRVLAADQDGQRGEVRQRRRLRDDQRRAEHRLQQAARARRRAGRRRRRATTRTARRNARPRRTPRP